MQSLFNFCRCEFRQLKGRIPKFRNEGLTSANDSLADDGRQWHFLLTSFGSSITQFNDQTTVDTFHDPWQLRGRFDNPYQKTIITIETGVASQ